MSSPVEGPPSSKSSMGACDQDVPAGNPQSHQGSEHACDQDLPNMQDEKEVGPSQSATFTSSSIAAALSLSKHSERLKQPLQMQNTAKRLQELSGPRSLMDAHSCLEALVESTRFDLVCGTAIVLNTCLMAYSTDYAMAHPSEPSNLFIDICEIVFAAFYTFELTAKMLAWRTRFFRGADCAWNMFDLTLVLTSFYDLAITHKIIITVGSRGGANLSFMRLLRLMKMLKILRIIRLMRFFRELRLMMASIIGSMRSMLWCVVLIFITVYMFAILFVQSITSYLQDPNVDHQAEVELRHFWDGISWSMLTLFKLSTGGLSWADPAEPLRYVGFIPYAGMCLYIMFFSIVIMNTMTSLFVEAAIDSGEQDAAMVIREELKKKAEYVENLKKLFQLADQDGSNELTLEEFEALSTSADEELEAFAASLQIDITEMEHTFKMLSGDGKEAVDAESFVVGCMKIKGAARSMDLIVLLQEVRRMEHEATNERRSTELQLKSIGASLRKLEGHIGGDPWKAG
eukprot:gnl/TRDRNA2_/TRDRNA2_175762_c0_seq16.p1 gnl/TRDRNA2_/TRDRNA2_175762_c0~~gnl/TRDRNA2_/TRDRNA2_175762_c0_seq16.p1  ORF type:complete len:537 (+),score=100.27 gnl/TRDRNA2_/TRDRNA2_175762_c0_seq16:67-1611(+)